MRFLGLTMVLATAMACSAGGNDASTSGGTTSGQGGAAGMTNSGGSGGTITVGSGGGTSGKDTDEDGIPDDIEGSGDSDGDGNPNYDDPINDGEPPAITLTGISTTFNNPIGIDYHEPTDTVVLSVNYPEGLPSGFERVDIAGAHQQFSNLSGFTDEVKIATARSGNPGGFVVGDLFVGNGIEGQIVRITDNGATIINPWVDLPGADNGLMRGSLYVDRTGELGGDLIVATTLGEVWRIDANATPTPIGSVGPIHLEGGVVVPNKPARYGPLAGKLLVGAEEQHVLFAFSPNGSYVSYTLGVDVEDIDIISPKENFFGVNFGTSRLLGAAATEFDPMMGDILLTQEVVTQGTSGLFRLKWDGTNVVAQPIPLSSAQVDPVDQWEHVTFARAGIVEIPPVPR